MRGPGEGEHEEAAVERIVVGVDGSEVSLVALRWALRYARRSDGVVHVFHSVWEAPVAGPSLHFGHREQGERPGELEGGAALVDRLLGEAGDLAEGVRVHRDLVAEPPAAALVERSHEADLIVVGTRGLGGVREVLLGSVSRQVVHGARCPVVVVPPPDR
jgi:nucleotide-binding universal stress UspA family protein